MGDGRVPLVVHLVKSETDAAVEDRDLNVPFGQAPRAIVVGARGEVALFAA